MQAPLLVRLGTSGMPPPTLSAGPPRRGRSGPGTDVQTSYSGSNTASSEKDPHLVHTSPTVSLRHIVSAFPLPLTSCGLRQSRKVCVQLLLAAVRGACDCLGAPLGRGTSCVCWRNTTSTKAYIQSRSLYFSHASMNYRTLADKRSVRPVSVDTTIHSVPTLSRPGDDSDSSRAVTREPQRT
jgi:hypothetical protein